MVVTSLRPHQTVSRLGLEPTAIALKAPALLKKINQIIDRGPPMSDKQLQRVTQGIADIGQAPVRRALLARGAHTTQEIPIAGIARPMSLALQYGDSHEKLSD